MRRSVFTLFSLAGLAAAATLPSLAAETGRGPVTPVPLDSIVLVGGVDVGCTGIGDEAQSDPRWRAFPIRVEVAGRNNEYLADALLTLAEANGTEIATVRCEGPWVLFRLPAGEYRVTASVAGASAPKTVRIAVPASGQRRAVIQFPDVSDY